MKILLADDNRNLCSALELILETRLNVSVVGAASNLAELVARLHEQLPDIIILDCELPGLGCNPNAIKALCPEAKIIALSARPEAEQTALRFGADRFISKISPPENLLETIGQLMSQKAAVE